MKKLTSQKQLNNIAKGALAVVLAGSFTFTASHVFADEPASQQDQYQTVDLQSGTNTGASTANTDASTANNAASANTATDTTTTNQTTQSQVTPSLLPGDFFYFAKIAFEKIQLALTFNDVKKAKLLADFASERLAEAKALLASGNQDTALKTIDNALEDMKDADSKVDSQKQSETKTSQANENTNADNSQSSTSAADQAKMDDSANQDNQAAAINNTLKQNIIALTAAMEKVKNPVAKAALKRNIEKSYAKLVKKFGETDPTIAKEDNKTTPKEDNETTQTPVTNVDNANQAAASVTTNNANMNDTAGTSPSETKTTVPTSDQQTAKTTHQEIQAAKQEAKQEVAQKREEMKSFVKEKKSEVRQKINEVKGNKH